MGKRGAKLRMRLAAYLTTASTSHQGNFKLTFRQEETASIAFNASAEVVERKLESLEGIYDLTVTYSYGTTFCITDDTDDSSLNVVQIQFITEHGDLPAITVDDSNLRDSNTGSCRVNPASDLTAQRSHNTRAVPFGCR